MGGRRAWTAAEGDRLRAMRAAGSTWRQCAAAMGRSVRSVKQAGARRGLTDPLNAGRGFQGAETRAAVLALVAAGESSARRLAVALGLSRTRVWQVLRDARAAGLARLTVTPGARGGVRAWAVTRRW